MNSNYSGSTLSPIFLKIRPEDIVRLKFVLESYEHLGVLRTLRKEDGIVAIFALEDTRPDVEKVLDALALELASVDSSSSPSPTSFASPSASPSPASSLGTQPEITHFHRLSLEELRSTGVVPEDAELDGNWDNCLWLVDSE